MRAHRGRHRQPAPGRDRRARHPTLRHRAGRLARTMGLRRVGQLRGRSRRRTHDLAPDGLGTDASGTGPAGPIPGGGRAASFGCDYGAGRDRGDLARAVDRGPRTCWPAWTPISPRPRPGSAHSRRRNSPPPSIPTSTGTTPMRCAALRPRSGDWMCGSASPTMRPGPGRSTGVVKITDAELLDRRAEALARSVCPDDPRTHGERRTEALGIIAVKGDVLPCRCGKPDCPAAGKDPRAEHLVIHVITNDPGDPGGPGRRRWSRRRWSRRRLVPTTTVLTRVMTPRPGPCRWRWARRC